MNPNSTIRTNSAGLRAMAARDAHHAETVQLDEVAIARMRRERDEELISGAIDLETRIRICGKDGDADLLRALRERVVDAMGDTP